MFPTVITSGNVFWTVITSGDVFPTVIKRGDMAARRQQAARRLSKEARCFLGRNKAKWLYLKTAISNNNAVEEVSTIFLF